MYKLRLILMIVFSLGLVTGAAVLALAGSNRAREDQEARSALRQLADSDPDVRNDAVQKLMKLGKLALPALRDACSSEDGQLARRARRLLDEMEGRIPQTAAETRVDDTPKPVVIDPVRPPVE